MKLQYDHLLLSSFKEWFDHTLLQEGRAFSNISSGRLYQSEDKQWKNYDVFNAPFHQWVYDASISGANVPSGVYVDNSFTPRGTDDLRIDFGRGRAIFDKNTATGNIVAADYSVKEFNIYLTSKPEDRLVLETKFLRRPISKTPSTGLDPNIFLLPAVFLRQRTSKNEGFSLGGEDLTTSTIRAICFSENEFQSIGIKSLFRDRKFTNFCLLKNTPINEFGDIKSGQVWNYYEELSNSMVMINDVVISDIENDLIADHHPGIYLSVIEFELIKARYPRQ